jgi:hypothetical protein
LFARAGFDPQVNFLLALGQSGQILVEDRLAVGVAELSEFFEKAYPTEMRRLFEWLKISARE